MAKTHIISFCTDESRARILRSSAAAQGFDVAILTAPAWEGYHQKLLHARDYVVEHLALDDLLLFADAYDVVFTRNLRDIERIFEESDSELLFGAEINCWPGYFRKNYFFRSPSRPTSAHKYLNSGFYVGTKKGVLDFLFWKNEEQLKRLCQNGGDQVYAHHYFLQRGHKRGVKLDHDTRLVLNMHHVRWTDLSIRDGAIENTPLGSVPCALHFNGGSFRDEQGKDITEIILEALSESRVSGVKLNIDYLPAFHKGNLPLSQTTNLRYGLITDKLEEWRSGKLLRKSKSSSKLQQNFGG
jgi:hypothetical protein